MYWSMYENTNKIISHSYPYIWNKAEICSCFRLDIDSNSILIMKSSWLWSCQRTSLNKCSINITANINQNRSTENTTKLMQYLHKRINIDLCSKWYQSHTDFITSDLKLVTDCYVHDVNWPHALALCTCIRIYMLFQQAVKMK